MNAKLLYVLRVNGIDIDSIYEHFVMSSWKDSGSQSGISRSEHEKDLENDLECDEESIQYYELGQ